MKIKKILIYLFAVGAVVLLIKNASSAIRYASDAIDLCLEMIVPTLFPFFIFEYIAIPTEPNINKGPELLQKASKRSASVFEM